MQAAVDHGDDEAAAAVYQECRAFAGGSGEFPAGKLLASIGIEQPPDLLIRARNEETHEVRRAR